MAYKRFHHPAPSVHRDQDQIRERLLHKLGVFHNDEPVATKHLVRPLQEQDDETEGQVPRLLTSEPRREALKKAAPLSPCDDTDELAFSSKSASRRVQFQTTVSVVEIPSHQDCDLETRQCLWTSVPDLRTNAERNKLEFRADGSCWQTAVEEDGMMVLEGHLVHPVTYWRKVQEMQKLSLFQQAFSSFFSLPVVSNTTTGCRMPTPPVVASTSSSMKRTQSSMSSLVRLADNN